MCLFAMSLKGDGAWLWLLLVLHVSNGCEGENEDGKKALTLQMFGVRVGNPGFTQSQSHQTQSPFILFPLCCTSDININ